MIKLKLFHYRFTLYIFCLSEGYKKLKSLQYQFSSGGYNNHSRAYGKAQVFNERECIYLYLVHAISLISLAF
jgi:hypothetical protein